MTRTPILLALACTLSLGTTTAQDGDPHDRKVRTFIAVSGRLTLGKLLAQQTLEKIKSTDRLPPGFLEAFTEACDPAQFVEHLVSVYDDLDDATLDAAIEFYSSEAGKRLAETQAKHDARLQVEISAWVEAGVAETLKRLGLPSREEQLQEARRHGNEAAALGALKTITTAQALFREGDKDGDGNFQYSGSLGALGKTQLIDEVLASGTKQGYRFELCAGSEAPEFLWMAVASPVDGKGRHFVINQSGVIYYSNEAPFALDRVTCEIPRSATPVGK